MKIPNFEYSGVNEENMTRQEQALKLRESLAKRIDYITEIRKKIEIPEIASMDAANFQSWAESEEKRIFDMFPETEVHIKRLLEIKEELESLDEPVSKKEEEIEVIKEAAVRLFLKDDKDRLESYLDGAMEIAEEVDLENEASTGEDDIKIQKLEDVLSDIRENIYQKNIEELRLLHDKNINFVYTAQNFFTEISDKKWKVENLKKAFETEGTAFVDEIKKEIPGALDIANYVKTVGKNIKIKFGTYEVIIYLSSEEAKKYFNKEKAGWHRSKTPFCFVVEGEDSDQNSLNYTTIHETGHNRMEPLSISGIHYTEYSDVSIPTLVKLIKTYKTLTSLFKTNKQILISQKNSIVHHLGNQILRLNGEISADAENIIKGDLKSFYFHTFNEIEKLYSVVFKEIKTGDKDVGNLLSGELGKVVKTAAELVKRIMFLAKVAEKYGLQDGFYATTIMSPDNTNLSRRYLEEKIGENFEFERMISLLLPEYSLPLVLQRRVYGAYQSHRFVEYIFDEGRKKRTIVNPDGVESNYQGLFKSARFGVLDHALTDTLRETDIFKPEFLDKFLNVVNSDNLKNINEEERKMIVRSLDMELTSSNSLNIFDHYFGLEKISELKKYADNIKKLAVIFGLKEKGIEFVDDFYSNCVYRILKKVIMIDNPEKLKYFFDCWVRPGYSPKSDLLNGNMYSASIDVESLIGLEREQLSESKETQKIDQDLVDRVINNPSSTKVFQYLNSLP